MTQFADEIVTHKTDPMRHFPNDDYRTFLLRCHVKSGLGPLPAPELFGGSLVAYISTGRWVIQCDACLSAVVGEPTDPVFCCTACGSGGVWKRAIYPPPALKAGIEKVLLMRPGFRNAAPKRNWTPTESLGLLMRQNIAAGDPIPMDMLGSLRE